jgi:hypothetical protein
MKHVQGVVVYWADMGYFSLAVCASSPGFYTCHSVFAVQLMTLTEKHWVAWLFYAAKEWRGWFHVRAEELISIGFKWSWMQRISSPLVSSAEWRKPNDKCKCCFSHVLMSRLHLTHLTFGIGSSTLYVVSDAVYRPYVGSWLCDSHGRVFVPLLSLSTKRLPNHFVGPG